MCRVQPEVRPVAEKTLREMTKADQSLISSGKYYFITSDDDFS